MTNWTEEDNVVTSYAEENDGTASYTETEDVISPFSPFGGLLYLATEGGDRLMTENYTYYIVVSEDDDTDYSEVEDIQTTYIKTPDA